VHNNLIINIYKTLTPVPSQRWEREGGRGKKYDKNIKKGGGLTAPKHASIT